MQNCYPRRASSPPTDALSFSSGCVWNPRRIATMIHRHYFLLAALLIFLSICSIDNSLIQSVSAESAEIPQDDIFTTHHFLSSTPRKVDPVQMNEHLRTCLADSSHESCQFPLIANKIPKLMHFVWFQSTDVPDQYLEALETWKENHPDWTIFLWTQIECENLIDHHYQWFLDFYHKYPWMIQQIDAVRYFIIHYFGGLVTDIDMASQRSLTPLIEDMVSKNDYDVILLPSVNMGGLSNGFAVAAPRNDFHGRAIRNLMNPRVPPIIKYTWWLNPAKRHTWIMISAGPRFITNERLRYEALPREKQQAKLGFFNPKQFLPCTACTPKPCSCPDCYITMLKGGLWHEKDSKLLDGLRCFFEPLVTTYLHWFLLGVMSVLALLAYIMYRYRSWILRRLFFFGVKAKKKITTKSTDHKL